MRSRLLHPDGRVVTFDAESGEVTVDGQVAVAYGRPDLYRDGGSRRIRFTLLTDNRVHELYLNRRLNTTAWETLDGVVLARPYTVSSRRPNMNPGQSDAVIAAFPATGKTYIAIRQPGVIDCSSSFSWMHPGTRERHPDWPGNYVEHIDALVRSGQTVLCSTHQEVRDALTAAGRTFTLVYPAEDQREVYLRRMRERGSGARLIDFIGSQWDALLASCRSQEGCEHIVLADGLYLADALGRRDA